MRLLMWDTADLYELDHTLQFFLVVFTALLLFACVLSVFESDNDEEDMKKAI